MGTSDPGGGGGSDGDDSDEENLDREFKEYLAVEENFCN